MAEIINKISVLILTNLFPNNEEPFRGIFVYQLIKELKKKCKVRVVLPLPWFPKIKFLKRLSGWYKFSNIPFKYDYEGIKVFYPKFLAIPKIGFSQSVFLFLRLFPVIYRLHKKERFDLINAHWLFPDGVTAFWIGKILKIPVMLSAHGCDVNAYTSHMLRKPQILSAIKGAQCTTLVSEQQDSTLKKLGVRSSNVKVIQNGVDSKMFYLMNKSECRRKLKIKYTKKIILFIGQHVEVKGFKYLISAVNELREMEIIDFRVYAVGEGPLQNSLLEKVCKHGLEDHFKFMGPQKYADIPVWLGASDLLCLPSLKEGCPCVVLEALASGRPVVASKVGSIPLMVNDESGILAEPGDSKSLAFSLKNAMRKNWNENSIRESVLEKSWGHTASKFYEIMKTIADSDAVTVHD